ncbi:MAG TPA: helix-turn-helix domain-containing protein [Gaiellaceae bacterium]|jgi:AcrR family transcriptional regulator|nr:helix-turn-helix domain-containing protein [Gaiellaceae bacterium]
MATTTRQTAAERREEVLEAAVAEFARAGFHGASTDAIARRAGISQPYLFRLFGSKKDLHLAVVRRCFRRTLEAMQAASEGLRGEEALEAMGQAYGLILSTDPVMLQSQLQMYAAALDDADVRQAVRDGYGDLYAYAERVSGASPKRLARFFANGMLLNVIAAMGFHEEAEPEAWAFRLMTGCREDDR